MAYLQQIARTLRQEVLASCAPLPSGSASPTVREQCTLRISCCRPVPSPPAGSVMWVRSSGRRTGR